MNIFLFLYIFNCIVAYLRSLVSCRLYTSRKRKILEKLKKLKKYTVFFRFFDFSKIFLLNIYIKLIYIYLFLYYKGVPSLTWSIVQIILYLVSQKPTE